MPIWFANSLIKINLIVDLVIVSTAQLIILDKFFYQVDTVFYI